MAWMAFHFGTRASKVNGIDVFDPATGDIRSLRPPRHFLGANDPYGSLKTALKAEIDEDAWQSLYSDT
jgi:adenine-specific DNA-methyltransferase